MSLDAHLKTLPERIILPNSPRSEVALTALNEADAWSLRMLLKGRPTDGESDERNVPGITDFVAHCYFHEVLQDVRRSITYGVATQSLLERNTPKRATEKQRDYVIDAVKRIHRIVQAAQSRPEIYILDHEIVGSELLYRVRDAIPTITLPQAEPDYTTTTARLEGILTHYTNDMLRDGCDWLFPNPLTNFSSTTLTAIMDACDEGDREKLEKIITPGELEVLYRKAKRKPLAEGAKKRSLLGKAYDLLQRLFSTEKVDVSQLEEEQRRQYKRNFDSYSFATAVILAQEQVRPGSALYLLDAA